MAQTTLHLRAEAKPLEHRSALTPSTTKALIDAGYTVNVESGVGKVTGTTRIFDDAEFTAVGAKIVAEGSWRDAPVEHIIVGLKELPEEDFPLKHTMVHFAHCYKGQENWEKVLARFPRGGGTLLDLEFLADPTTGRRVAAFGYHAGFSGAALALENWAWQLTHPSSEPFPSVSSYPNETELTKDVKAALAAGSAKAGRMPRVIVIGARGRCGSGAVDMCLQAGVPSENILQWDMAETAKGGPFKEITDADCFINCIYLSSPIPPFVSMESLKAADRKLSVICDVSADTTNKNNPVPVYTIATTFDKPTVPVEVEAGGPPLSVISIDHLPSLLPREASDAFSQALLPYLLQLKEWRSNPVWAGAEKLYKEKVETLPAKYLN